VSLFSKDIAIEFGFGKNAMLSIKRGVRVKNEGITVPSRKLIKEVYDGGHKYLRVARRLLNKLNI